MFRAKFELSKPGFHIGAQGRSLTYCCTGIAKDMIDPAIMKL